MKFLHKTQLFLNSFSKQQNSAIQKWSPIAKCLSQKCYETRIKSYKGEIKTVILIFSVPKSQNSYEEEKNSITAKRMLVTIATPISSQVKDKNSIFTARDEDIIFK